MTAETSETDAGLWEQLRSEAVEARDQAYAPYSEFPVGAAARVDDGRVVSGCNVENASYGLGLCAECGLVSALRRTGGGRLTHFACVGGDSAPLMPCGRCRQMIREARDVGAAEIRIICAGAHGETMRVYGIDDLLPDAFGPSNLSQGTA